MKYNATLIKIVSLFVLLSFMMSPLQIYALQDSSPNQDMANINGQINFTEEDLQKLLSDLDNQEASVSDYKIDPTGMDRLSAIENALSGELETLSGTPRLDENLDLGSLLPDTTSDYRETWEAWETKAAIRTMITSPDYEFLLAGGGYLYDNEIKVYRYNYGSNQYDHVWDSGDSVIGSDVVSLGWGDTDNNKFPEIVAGSADGHVYVFEQVHIYDPKTNTENRFDLVWKSPDLKQVWGLAVDDTDLDYDVDIIAGSWDGKIHFFEYVDRSGYPFTQEHWIDYEEKFTAQLPGNERITALTTADTNYNGLPEVIVGTWSGNVYIYENNGTVLNVNGKPFPLTQDDSYKLIYQNTDQFWNPITKISVGNLDDDDQDELAFLVPTQGVYTFDFESDLNNYYFNKLTKPPASWELGTGHLDEASAGYPVNSYVDWMLSGHDVYAYGAAADFKEEPILEVRPAYPYNTSMAQPPNDDYSWFIPQGIGLNASAIVDFGYAQSASGDGRFADGLSLKGYDLLFYMEETIAPKPNQWQIELSKDLEVWTTIDVSEMTTGSEVVNGTTKKVMYIDTDPALNRKRMLDYRYIKMTFFAPGFQLIDSIKTTTLGGHLLLTEVTGLTLGSVDVDYGLSLSFDNEPDKIIVGTVYGKLFVYDYDKSAGEVNMIWESYTEDLYRVGTQIWDIVQIKNAGKFPTWLGYENANTTVNINTVGLASDYHSHTHAHLNAFELMSPYFIRGNDDLIVTDKDGTTYLFPYSGSDYSVSGSQAYFQGVNNYFLTNNYEVTQGFGDMNGDGYPEYMISGAWDPLTIANPSTNSKADAKLLLWMSGGPMSGFPGYLGPINLAELDQTGLLSRALEQSQAQPAACFTDLDRDGDQDIVFTNGKVYVLWNIKANLMFQLDSGYFADLNDNTRGRLYTSPQVVNFDGDDDDDLVFSFSQTGDKPKFGATYWQNDGSALEPKWVEYKWLMANPQPSSHLGYNNYTNIQFLRNPVGKIINMTAYGAKQNEIVGFIADYTNHDHFMVATYPLIRRLEVNLRNSTTIRNWGYRIFETWNTKPELAEFTQAISHADLDQDGKDEIVVGDFDNNLYIFEYLTSGLNGSVNTYKRAYRSFDLNQTDRLDESPYASEELAGLSGEFNRTLWKHANYILTGTDLDRDGNLEVIVTAGLAVFVFESKSGIGILADSYELMWMQDLRFSKLGEDIKGYPEVTALGGGVDMDYNNKGEIILAIGPYIMIYEYSFMNGFQEVFAGYPDGLGRYALPGNVEFADKMNNYILENLQITSICVGNIESNRYQDIVVAGYYEQPFGRIDGFLAILEHRLGTIIPTYVMDQKVLRDLPIVEVLFADQDYDGNQELVIGHKKGVDVWEFKPNELSEVILEKLTHITTSMNHPIVDLNPIFLLPLQGIQKDQIQVRDHDLITIRYAVGDLEPNDLFEAVTVEVGSVGVMVFIYSKDDGLTWHPMNARQAYSGVTLMKEFNPSVVQLKDGRIVVSWVAHISISGAGFFTSVYGSEYDNTLDSGSFKFSVPSAIRTTSGVNATDPYFYNPSIFENPNINGLAMITYFNGVNDTIEIKKRQSANYWGSTSTNEGFIDNIGPATENKTFFAGSHDVVYHRPTESFIIAFSGYKYSELKPDYDIFVAYCNNDSLIFNFTSRVTTSSVDDLYPSISTLFDENDYSLIIAYEEIGIRPGNRIMVAHSENLGITWSEPEDLPVQPSFAVNYCFEGLGCFMFFKSPESEEAKNELLYSDSDTETYEATDKAKMSMYQFYWITSIEVFSPAISGRPDGGFAFTFGSVIYWGSLQYFLNTIVYAIQTGLTAGVYYYTGGQQYNAVLSSVNDVRQATELTETPPLGQIVTIMSGINPDSTFAKFKNGATKSIAVGDSDQDARQEILIGAENGVFLNEISHTGYEMREYTEIWSKIDYNNEINDVALHDTNGNGFAEVMVAAAEGNVYTYEIVELQAPRTDLQFLATVDEDYFDGYPSTPPPEKQYSVMKAVDVNGDKVKDVIYATLDNSNNELRIVDGTNGQLIIGLDLANDYGIASSVTTLEIAEITGDRSYDYILGFGHGEVLGIDGSSFEAIIKHTTTTSPVKKLIPDFYDNGSFLSIHENYILILDDSEIIRYVYVEDIGSIVDVLIVNTGTQELILVLGSNGVAQLFNAEFTLEKTFVDSYAIESAVPGSIAVGDINNDGSDEIFIAANGVLFAYDAEGTQLWNVTGVELDTSLSQLQIAPNFEDDNYQVIVASDTQLIDFEDSTHFTGIQDLYRKYGVQFSSSWVGYNATQLNNPLFPARSGHMFAWGASDSAKITFNESQQYISFYADMGSEYSVRIRALDESNRTVYLTDYINTGTLIPIRLYSNQRNIKTIEFTGRTGFNNYFVIDDLRVGGTSLIAFDGLTGKQTWRTEHLPTSEIVFNVGDRADFNSLLVSYDIAEEWQSPFYGHTGSLALFIDSGKPIWTSNTNIENHEVVAIKPGKYAFLSERSLLQTRQIITDVYYPSIAYDAQNDAIWEVQTQKQFTDIYRGNFDNDPQDEIIGVITPGTNLVVAIDNDGRFLWKYRAASNIRSVFFGKFLDDTVNQVGILTNDGTITLLNPKIGLPVLEEFFTSYIIYSVVVSDLDNNGIDDIIIGGRPYSNPAKGRLEVHKFSRNAGSFYLAWYKNLNGQIIDIRLENLDGGTTKNDMYLLGYKQLVYAYDQDGNSLGMLGGYDSVMMMTTGDFSGDGVADVAYINKNSKLRVFEGPALSTQLLIDPIDIEYGKISSISAFNLDNDSYMDIAIHVQGVKLVIYEMEYHYKFFWEDSAIYSRIVALADMDRDGIEDIILQNDNMIYALHGGGWSLFPCWSTNIPLNRISSVLVSDIDGDSYQDLVILDENGGFYTVTGINNPATLARPSILPGTQEPWNSYVWTTELDDKTVSDDSLQHKTSINEVQIDYSAFTFFFGVMGGFIMPIVLHIFNKRKNQVKKPIPEPSSVSLGGVNQ